MKVIGTDKNGNEIAEVSVTELDTMFKEIRAKAIDEFYDKVLNFEDYIEPIGVTGITEYRTLLYSGGDITDMIVKIKEQLKAGGVE